MVLVESSFCILKIENGSLSNLRKPWRAEYSEGGTITWFLMTMFSYIL